MKITKKHMDWSNVQFSLLQILVVVANIQVKTLKAEVEKGSMRTVIDHGLVGPKKRINFVNSGIRHFYLYWWHQGCLAFQKGNTLILE